MEITRKFVEKYLGDDFQCLYGTQDNTEMYIPISVLVVCYGVPKKGNITKGEIGQKKSSQ